MLASFGLGPFALEKTGTDARSVCSSGARGAPSGSGVYLRARQAPVRLNARPWVGGDSANRLFQTNEYKVLFAIVYAGTGLKKVRIAKRAK